MCLVNEEMSWGDAGIALAIFGSTLAVAGIFANGTPEQIGEWIPQCFGTPDDMKLAAFGVSEPDAGSDVSSLKSRAVYDEAKDEWVLNGTKTWITNGGIANTHVLVLSVDPELGSRGQASFVVPEGTPGISQGQKFKKMGIRASHTAEVVLDDCRVPGRCLLGGKEKLDERLARAQEGKKTSTQAAMATFEASRPIVGAQAVGIARAAYEYALDYAKERKQFGRAIIENQAIAFKLADMKMHTDAARLLVHRAANMASTGKQFENGEGSMSKLYAGENAVWVTEQAIQILGGYGYVREYPVEQWHRDSKIYTIFEGTSEIQRLVICTGDQRHPHQLTRPGPGAPPAGAAGASPTKPWRWAYAAAWARSRLLVLAKIRFTCVLTVASATKSRAAISVFDRPAAISARTSASRSVSPSGSGAGRGGRAGGAWCAALSKAAWAAGSSTDCPATAASSARRMSSRDASLVRYPAAPAERPAMMESSSAKVVRTTTGSVGWRARIARVASTPSMRGMRRSMSTTSGACVAARSRASRPSPARPTTTVSANPPTMVARPSRTTRWSSAMRTLTTPLLHAPPPSRRRAAPMR